MDTIEMAKMLQKLHLALLHQMNHKFDDNLVFIREQMTDLISKMVKEVDKGF